MKYFVYGFLWKTPEMTILHGAISKSKAYSIAKVYNDVAHWEEEATITSINEITREEYDKLDV